MGGLGVVYRCEEDSCCLESYLGAFHRKVRAWEKQFTIVERAEEGKVAMEMLSLTKNAVLT